MSGTATGLFIKAMECSRGSWIFVLLVLLCFLVIPIRIAVYRYQVPSKYVDKLFHQFSKQFNKTYGSPAEFQKRYSIFAVSSPLQHIRSQQF